jgi:Hemerythrin HHE cation binding domain
MSDDGNPYADTRHMYKVHTMFRREFALLPGLVRSVPARDDERAQAAAGHIRLVNLVLHHHHTSEDEVLWPLLLARAPRDIDPVVHLMEGHHRGIESILAEVDELLGTWTGSAACEDGEALAEALEQLAVGLFEHMGLEEKLVLPIAQRHIFAAEWEKMVADGAAAIPPDVGPVLAGMLMYEGGVDVVPPEMRAVLAELAPQAYAAHCERVHGTPTPPRSAQVGIGTPYVGVTADADSALIAGNRVSVLSVPAKNSGGAAESSGPTGLFHFRTVASTAEKGVTVSLMASTVNPPAVRRSVYSAAVRSLPPDMASMIRSVALLKWGPSPGGTTHSMTTSRAPGRAASAMVFRIRTEDASSQSGDVTQ